MAADTAGWRLIKPPRAYGRGVKPKRAKTDDEAHVTFGVGTATPFDQPPAKAATAPATFQAYILIDDPSAGSPTETLLRLLPGSSRCD